MTTWTVLDRVRESGLRAPAETIAELRAEAAIYQLVPDADAIREISERHGVQEIITYAVISAVVGGRR